MGMLPSMGQKAKDDRQTGCTGTDTHSKKESLREVARLDLPSHGDCSHLSF